MALFRYTAISEGKKEYIGLINADSLELAKERLRRRQILVVAVSPYAKQGKRFTLPSALLIDVTRGVHTLLRAGLPLHEALLTLEEKYQRTRLHPVLLNLCDRVSEGVLLSDTLKEYPKVFDPIYVSMVQAGEASGSLEQSFAELEKLLGQTGALKKKLVSAMIYPAFLGVFCFAVIAILLFFLIPSMSELFEGRELHPMTEGVLSLSRFLNAHTLIFGVTMTMGPLGIFLFLRHPSGVRWTKGALLYLPIVKRVCIEVVMARFCRVFAVLFKGGVPMIDALRLAKKVMKHPTFEEIVNQAEKRVLEGRNLSEEFQRSPLIPTLVVRMLAIGEESGKLAEMMHHLAEIYEEDIERSLSRLTSFVQPVMLLVLGVIVAVVLLAVLLPLTDVTSILQ